MGEVERGLPFGRTLRSGQVGAAVPLAPWGRSLMSLLFASPGLRARAGSGRADPEAARPPAWERQAQGAEPVEVGGVLAARPEACVCVRRAVGAAGRLCGLDCWRSSPCCPGQRAGEAAGPHGAAGTGHGPEGEGARAAASTGPAPCVPAPARRVPGIFGAPASWGRGGRPCVRAGVR